MTIASDTLGRAIIESAAEAVIYSDRAGIIRYWNAGAERIFGHTSEEALGQSLDIIIPENLRAAHWHGYRQVMETGDSRYGAGDLLAVPGIRKDGTRISLEFTVVPIAGEEGHLDGIAAVLRDVTDKFEEMKDLKARIKAMQAPAT